MKHRSVVSNFVFKGESVDQAQQIALFKRSTHPNIRSYQGKYSPIAGSIEEQDAYPLAAAEREIYEETQLVCGRDLVLGFTGRPFSFEDEQAQRSWTVHPFGWLLKADESKIQIDWEHSGWKWFDPQAVLDGGIDDDCVPRLKVSLRRVYLGPNGMFGSGNGLITRNNAAGQAFLRTIEKLKNDTENGARVLATDALKGLVEITKCIFSTEDGLLSPEYWYALRVAAWHFIYSARTSMNAAIASAIVNALAQIAHATNVLQNDPKAACDILEQSIANRQKTSTEIAKAFKKYVDTLVTRQQQEEPAINIITLSDSSTILASLTHLVELAQENLLRLNFTILESRPACEGASLAASLLSSLNDKAASRDEPARVSVRIVPDSHSAFVLREPKDAGDSRKPHTVVLLGADRITPSGHVVNKTGSTALAVLARCLPGRGNREVVVLSETDKIAVPKQDVLASYEQLLAKPDEEGVTDGLAAELSRQELKLEPDEQHDSAEISCIWPESARNMVQSYMQAAGSSSVRNAVTIENSYFELIPAEYIDAYIAEDGEISKEDVLRKSVNKAKKESNLFEDLYEVD
ncbi:hypothetical protein LTS08_006463 [Lithohypha guttulata]|uniref:uncharacterized protein n=1 Tax=Lithohypha guttulata TaxID=1690604 RepID=UPI002DE1A4DD|nr:hypothetical protein LTR51_000763 [Lithohypha guttulata]KAK5098330.1 hypothetical protein LTS08_006463 [Lithohypha guttulata]